MARTPLMNLLLRSYRTLAKASRTGVPADELAQQERVRQSLSRRELIRHASLTAGALTLSACGAAELSGEEASGVGRNTAVDPMPLRSSGNDEVAIVGAGIAGVHCAYRL